MHNHDVSTPLTHCNMFTDNYDNISKDATSHELVFIDQTYLMKGTA